MFEQVLTQTGLSANQATVYEVLLREGVITASKISQKTPLKRGITYKILDELVALGLVQKTDVPGKVATFTAQHPAALRDMVAQRETEANRAKEVINQLIPQLASEYNLALNKPGVRFFEGREGFRTALEDSLNATETIYTYADLESVLKYVADIDEAYLKKRITRQVPKRLLLADTSLTREFMGKNVTDFTETKFLPAALKPFKTGMQIYNGKVAYFTMRPNNIIAVIVEDQDLYQMHRNIFDFFWASALATTTAAKKTTPPGSGQSVQPAQTHTPVAPSYLGE